MLVKRKDICMELVAKKMNDSTDYPKDKFQKIIKISKVYHTRIALIPHIRDFL